jgi:hypothetical protein
MKDHHSRITNAFAKLFWWHPPSLGALIGIGWGIGFTFRAFDHPAQVGLEEEAFPQ